jgi:hypothetical protein
MFALGFAAGVTTFFLLLLAFCIGAAVGSNKE